MCKEVTAGTLRTLSWQRFQLNSTKRGNQMKKPILVLLTVVAMSIFGYACKNEQNTNATDTGATATDTSATTSTMSTTDQTMTGTTGTMSTTDTSMMGTSGTSGTGMTSTDTSGSLSTTTILS